MGDRLGWIPLLQGCLGAALGEGVSTDIVSTVDPLKKEVVLKLQDPLPKGCWNSFQRLVHGYALANDCAIRKIRKKGTRSYIAEVLLKRRSGPTMANDALEMEATKPEQWKKEFYEKLRHKPRVTL